MMPQKKNPYPFEYARTAGAHAVGEMTAAYTTLHNTNYQDTKDVEEGLAPPVFRSLADVERILHLLEGTISSVEVDEDVMMAQAARHFATCTELAAAIHRNTDLSFRTAHRVVGNLVLKAIKGGLDATEVNSDLVDSSAQEVLGRALGLSDDLVRKALHPKHFVAAHSIDGGPAPEPMRAAIETARERLAKDIQYIMDQRVNLARARQARDDFTFRILED